MKHKVGNKFIAEIKESDDTMASYKMSDMFWADDEILDSLPPYEEPKPLAWRDGAKEQPAGEDIIMLLKQNYNLYPYSLVPLKKLDGENRYNQKVYDDKYAYSTLWKDCLWLPADKFPSILFPEPKPTIESCPFCGGKCYVVGGIHNDNYMYWIACSNDEGCGYRSTMENSEITAIETHNELYQSSGG